MARYNCIALSVYVCRTSTPRELEMFWRRQECHSEMIPQGLALHSSQLTSSQGKGSLSACSNLRAPPPTATRSFTFYLHRRADWFIREGGRREIRCNPDSCFFRGPKSGGGRGHTEKEVEPRVPHQRGTTTLPSPSTPGLEQKCPGTPGSRVN